MNNKPSQQSEWYCEHESKRADFPYPKCDAQCGYCLGVDMNMEPSQQNTNHLIGGHAGCSYPDCEWYNGRCLCFQQPSQLRNNQRVFDTAPLLAAEQHSTLLLESDMQEVIRIVHELDPTTISPTEEELEREAEEYADEHYLLHTDSAWKAAKDTYLAAAKRYTRQGEQDWEALYISEHLNLLAAKGRIAQLEQQWISVEERLPEKPGCYIVYEKETNIETLYFTGTHFQGAFEEVTHWQRLPSPPNTKQVK